MLQVFKVQDGAYYHKRVYYFLSWKKFDLRGEQRKID